jgi:hypothetical protein
MMGSKATLVRRHYGRERIGADREIDSWSFAYDFSVPLFSRVRLRGEGFVGSNLIPFQGGVLQGVAVLNPGGGAPIQFNKIGGAGGWGELIVKLTSDNRNVLYFGGGTDDPKDSNLLPGSGRSKNTLAWASYFHKLTDNVTTAMEWSNWQFRTRNFAGGVPSQMIRLGAATYSTWPWRISSSSRSKESPSPFLEFLGFRERRLQSGSFWYPNQAKSIGIVGTFRANEVNKRSVTATRASDIRHCDSKRVRKYAWAASIDS